MDPSLSCLCGVRTELRKVSDTIPINRCSEEGGGFGKGKPWLQLAPYLYGMLGTSGSGVVVHTILAKGRKWVKSQAFTHPLGGRITHVQKSLGAFLQEHQQHGRVAFHGKGVQTAARGQA